MHIDAALAGSSTGASICINLADGVQMFTVCIALADHDVVVLLEADIVMIQLDAVKILDTELI